MTSSLDLTKFPRALPAQVARTLGDGKPTAALVEWEERSSGWFKRTAADLDRRTTTVEQVSGDNSARITTEETTRANADGALAQRITTVEATSSDNTGAINNEITARANGDSALAQQITTVDAKVGTVSANGQIYFAAVATPAGATAAFGVFLTAGASFAGFAILAMSGGGSAIGLTANQFTFTDSGTAQQVFTYSGGKFRFGVPVEVQGVDLANGAAARGDVQEGLTTATAQVNVRAGATCLVTAVYRGPQNLNTLTDALITTYAAGNALDTVTVSNINVTSGGITTKYYFNTTLISKWVAPSDELVTFQAVLTAPPTIAIIRIAVIELK